MKGNMTQTTTDQSPATPVNPATESEALPYKRHFRIKIIAEFPSLSVLYDFTQFAMEFNDPSREQRVEFIGGGPYKKHED